MFKTLILAIACTATILLAPAPAEAKAVMVQPGIAYFEGREPVLYVNHVAHTRWFYVEIANNETWMVTRCRQEDSRNCWWDAKRRGNGVGHSFVNLRGRYHWTVRGTLIVR